MRLNVGILVLYLWLSKRGVLSLPCFKLARHESELEMGIEALLRRNGLVLESRYIEATIAAHIRFFPCAELLGCIEIYSPALSFPLVRQDDVGINELQRLPKGDLSPI